MAGRPSRNIGTMKISSTCTSSVTCERIPVNWPQTCRGCWLGPLRDFLGDSSVISIAASDWAQIGP